MLFLSSHPTQWQVEETKNWASTLTSVQSGWAEWIHVFLFHWNYIFHVNRKAPPPRFGGTTASHFSVIGVKRLHLFTEDSTTFIVFLGLLHMLLVLPLLTMLMMLMIHDFMQLLVLTCRISAQSKPRPHIFISHIRKSPLVEILFWCSIILIINLINNYNF